MSIITAERKLQDLAIRVDGRNAHNGLCTWVDVRDGIETALAELRADGSVAPSISLARERADLADLEEMAAELAARAHLIRVSAHDNQRVGKLRVAS